MPSVDPARIEFSFAVSESSLGSQRLESATVTLPYSIGVALGLVMSIPFTYQANNIPTTASATAKLNATANPPVPFGFQAQELDLKQRNYFALLAGAPFSSACAWNNRVIAVVHNNLVAIEGGKIFSYAGSGVESAEDATNRFRTWTASQGNLHCEPGGLIYGDLLRRRIFKFSDSGAATRLAGSDVRAASISNDGELATQATLDDVTSVTLDSKGTLYFAERTQNRVRMVDAEGKIRTVAQVPALTGTDVETGLYASWELDLRRKDRASVTDMAMGSDGFLYVTNNATILKVNISTGVSSVIVGNGQFGMPTMGIAATETPFRRMHGVAFDQENRLVFADSLGLYRREASGLVTALTMVHDVNSVGAGRIGGTPESRGLVNPSTPAASVSLYWVQDLAMDPKTGKIIITELDTIRSLDASGNLLRIADREFAPGTINSNPCTQEEAGNSSVIPLATALKTMPGGDLLVKTTKITESPFNPSIAGTMDPLFQGGSVVRRGRSGVDGIYTSKQVTNCLPDPQQQVPLRLDADILPINDHEFLALNYNKIWKYDLNTGEVTSYHSAFRIPNPVVVTTVAGLNDPTRYWELPTGAMAKRPDGSIVVVSLLARQLNGSSELYVRSMAELNSGMIDYTAMIGSDVGIRVTRLNTDGTATEIYRTPSFTGVPRELFQADRNLNNWSVPWPSIDVLPDGGLLISAFWNHQLLRLSLEGTLAAIAGTGVAGFSGDGGPATNAQLHIPTSIAHTQSGEIFLVDARNRKIRRLIPSAAGSYSISTFLGNQKATDCGTGVMTGSAATIDAVDDLLRSSMSVICEGIPRIVAIDDTCPGPNGVTRIYVSQTFRTTHSNVMEIKRPCSN